MNYEIDSNQQEMESPFSGYNAYLSDWVHGSFDEPDINVQLSECDITFLLDLMSRYLIDLQSGNNISNACPINEAQWLAWRWINLICIRSKMFEPEVIRTKLLKECKTLSLEEQTELMSCFDRNIVFDNVEEVKT